jgi:hypothetical protein
MMTAFQDQINNPHFSKEYQKNIESFPSVFKKSNGEFTAFASAMSNHIPVMSKNFSPPKNQPAAGKV